MWESTTHGMGFVLSYSPTFLPNAETESLNDSSSTPRSHKTRGRSRCGTRWNGGALRARISRRHCGTSGARCVLGGGTSWPPLGCGTATQKTASLTSGGSSNGAPSAFTATRRPTGRTKTRGTIPANRCSDSPNGRSGGSLNSAPTTVSRNSANKTSRTVGVSKRGYSDYSPSESGKNGI